LDIFQLRNLLYIVFVATFLFRRKGRLHCWGWVFSSPIPSLNVAGKMTVMFRLFNKKGQAVKNWRSRAMLIDLHKTKVTISYST
jgi:hypothetical protein